MTLLSLLKVLDPDFTLEISEAKYEFKFHGSCRVIKEFLSPWTCSRYKVLAIEGYGDAEAENGAAISVTIYLDESNED